MCLCVSLSLMNISMCVLWNMVCVCVCLMDFNVCVCYVIVCVCGGGVLAGVWITFTDYKRTPYSSCWFPEQTGSLFLDLREHTTTLHVRISTD